MNSVLIIDDDRFIRKILEKSLSSTFSVRTAEDGEEGLALARSHHPDAILLDVEMPGMNGYEVCDHIRQDPEIADIPVLFLSGKSSLRERMLGYEAGANDYLVKPCDIDELTVKIKSLIALREKNLELHHQKSLAQDVAMSAMTGSSELGLAIQYLESTYGETSIEGLAERLLNTLGQLGLKASVLYNGINGIGFAGSDGETSPLETELLTLLRHEGRFKDFGCRTQINYNLISVLIKNMPIDNHERYGQIKDLLPAFLSATDARIKALNAEIGVADEFKNLKIHVDVIEKSLLGLKDNIVINSNQGGKILHKLLHDLSFEVSKLGMDTDQEEYLIKMVDAAITDSIDVSNRNEDVEKTVSNICRFLQHITQRQEKLMIHMQQREEVSKTEEEGLDSIELF